MTTFSQLVDEMTKETVRPDLQDFIASAINQTIREVHTGPQGQRLRLAANRVELGIEVPSSQPRKYDWEIPNFQIFQASEAYYYQDVGRYAKERRPGTVRMSRDRDLNDVSYWYQSGAAICFFGYGGSGAVILASLFYYPRSLVYYPERGRPAEIDPLTLQWEFNPDNSFIDDTAMRRTSNWLLQRHTDLIREGVRAKVWKRLGDQTRAPIAYSAFQDMRLSFASQESIQEESYFER